MTVAYPPRDCPICGSIARRVFFHQEFAAVDQTTPVTGYDVVVCQQCGAGYAAEIPDQAAFDRYYRDMSKYEYPQREGAESEYDRRRLTLIADFIEPYLATPDVRILDVGCATGRLLANIRDRGFARVRCRGSTALWHRCAHDDARRDGPDWPAFRLRDPGGRA
jgi:hypothetical protein